MITITTINYYYTTVLILLSLILMLSAGCYHTLNVSSCIPKLDQSLKQIQSHKWNPYQYIHILIRVAILPGVWLYVSLDFHLPSSQSLTSSIHRMALQQHLLNSWLHERDLQTPGLQCHCSMRLSTVGMMTWFDQDDFVWNHIAIWIHLTLNAEFIQGNIRPTGPDKVHSLVLQKERWFGMRSSWRIAFATFPSIPKSILSETHSFSYCKYAKWFEQ